MDYYIHVQIYERCVNCRPFPNLCHVHVSELYGGAAWPPASYGGGNLLLRYVTNMKGAFRNVFFLEGVRD